MSSNDCPDTNGSRRTRLQEAKRKRITDEKLNEEIELKRQREMFALEKSIGPRDVVVEVKVEKDAEISSSVNLEVDSRLVVEVDKYAACSSMVKLEVDSLVVKVEETLDLEESTFSEQLSEHSLQIEPDIDKEVISAVIEQSEKLPEISLESEDDKYLKDHIKSLEVLVDHKDQEINLLVQLLNDLNVQFNATELESNEISKMESSNVDAFQNKDSAGNVMVKENCKQIVTQMTSDLTEKNSRTLLLNTKLINLQTEFLNRMNYSLKIIKDPSPSNFSAQESFHLVLPFLYPELQFNDILNCHKVCPEWGRAINTFFNNHSSMKPFDKENYLKEFQQLEFDYIQEWNESPLNELANMYNFSDMRALYTLANDKRAVIIGSRVGLNNLILKNLDGVFPLNKFLDRHGSQINYFEIQQSIESPDFKLDFLMDRVKICLQKLENLKGLKIVFCLNGYKIPNKSSWDQLMNVGLASCNDWNTETFPKLSNLESLVIDVQIVNGWTLNANFLENFSKSLIEPYSNQLQQLSIFARCIGDGYLLNFPNLKELAIPQRYLDKIANFGCKKVEKCSFTSCSETLTRKAMRAIANLFPKLVFLGFKLEYICDIFEYEINRCTLKLPNILIIELNNCENLSLDIVSCFPNLRCIKFIKKNSNDQSMYKYNDDRVVNTTELWQGKSLYEFQQLWEECSNLRRVKLEFVGEPMKIMKQRLLTWTRQGFIRYRKNIDKIK